MVEYAYALAKAQRFDEALQTLDLLKDPNTSRALNYRGYATRKLGRTDEGIGYYLKSVAMDPNYAQVREYLGEAYALQGKLDLARQQLDTIAKICGSTDVRGIRRSFRCARPSWRRVTLARRAAAAARRFKKRLGGVDVDENRIAGACRAARRRCVFGGAAACRLPLCPRRVGQDRRLRRHPVLYGAVRRRAAAAAAGDCARTRRRAGAGVRRRDASGGAGARRSSRCWRRSSSIRAPITAK